MANRYTLRLRDIYDADEQPMGQRLGNATGLGIANAIEEYRRERELGRNERNKLALAGARPAGRDIRAPSRGEVYRPGADVGRVVDQNIAAPRSTGRAQIQALLPGGGRAPGGAPSQPARPVPGLRGAGGMGAPSSPARGMPGVGIASAIRGSLDPVTIEGRSGERYVIDPERQAKADFALDQQQGAIQYQTRQQRSADERARQAGVLRSRYGEEDARLYSEFPNLNPDRFRPPTTLDLQQRIQLEQEKARQRQELETLRHQYDEAEIRLKAATGSGDADAARQARVELAALGVQLRALGVEASAIPRYSGIDRSIMGGTAAGQKSVAAADSARADVGRRARDVAGDAVQVVNPTVPPPAGDGESPGLMRAKELMGQGLTKEQIAAILRAEGYAVAGQP